MRPRRHLLRTNDTPVVFMSTTEQCLFFKNFMFNFFLAFVTFSISTLGCDLDATYCVHMAPPLFLCQRPINVCFFFNFGFDHVLMCAPLGINIVGGDLDAICRLNMARHPTKFITCNANIVGCDLDATYCVQMTPPLFLCQQPSNVCFLKILCLTSF